MPRSTGNELCNESRHPPHSRVGFSRYHEGRRSYSISQLCFIEDMLGALFHPGSSRAVRRAPTPHSFAGRNELLLQNHS